MRVVMINDCAHVGETLLKGITSDVNAVHLKRTRSFFDKTVGIASKILKSKGEIYHCHYLLQDCWLTLKIGKHPTIGHAHGSDVRALQHPFWGKIVRYDLENCDKIVVSTPNMLDDSRKHNDTAEYIPNPIDESIFFPKRRRNHKSKVLIVSSCNWKVKGTDKIIRALKSISKDMEVSMIKYGVDLLKTLRLIKLLEFPVKLLPPIPHHRMSEYYWDSDVVVAAIGVDGTLGMVALEGIGCGRPVVTRVSSKHTAYRGFPLLDVDTSEDIAEAVLKADEKLWKKQYSYLKENHSLEKISRRFMRIYHNLVYTDKHD